MLAKVLTLFLDQLQPVATFNRLQFMLPISWEVFLTAREQSALSLGCRLSSSCGLALELTMIVFNFGWLYGSPCAFSLTVLVFYFLLLRFSELKVMLINLWAEKGFPISGGTIFDSCRLLTIIGKKRRCVTVDSSVHDLYYFWWKVNFKFLRLGLTVNLLK